MTRVWHSASPQTAAGVALGLVLLGAALVLWSGTGPYSNASRRRGPRGRLPRVGITPLVLINTCLGVPCFMSGLIFLGSGPECAVEAIVALSIAAAIWCVFGALLWRQHRRRREGLPA